MKKKEFLTETKKKALLSDREKAIVESFKNTFNKIKRIDETYDFASAEREYFDKKDIEDSVVIVIPYMERELVSVPSLNKEKIKYVGPDYKLVDDKEEAQVFSQEEAEHVKSKLANKKAYIEPAYF